MSRIVTKVFLGHFGNIKDVFNDFGVPKVIFVTICVFRKEIAIFGPPRRTVQQIPL